MKEITITFYNGVIESVENIPKGQTVITRDIDDEGEIELITRRWYFDGTSREVYAGEVKDEKREEDEKS